MITSPWDISDSDETRALTAIWNGVEECAAEWRSILFDHWEGADADSAREEHTDILCSFLAGEDAYIYALHALGACATERNAHIIGSAA